MRRIVQYPASTHYSDIKISPQWHQWLRHTRSNPPSLTEQSQDIIRQQNLKVLAAEADARWAAKPSFLDSPGQARAQLLSIMEVKDPEGNAESENSVDAGKHPERESERITKEMDIFADDRWAEAQKEEIHGIATQSNERSEHDKKSRADSNKDKADPWNQARGSDKWQPAAWDGNITSLRRQ
jgi:NADH dehydrogenase [ubiquinone] 1 alpha subcomplex assembly factor 2